MQIIKEFKEFAVKGNMFDMAIGIIIRNQRYIKKSK